MLAYAAGRRRVAERQSSPNAMLFVLCGHIVVVAAVMSARMDLPRHIFYPATPLIRVPLTPDPPPVRTPQPQPVKHITTVSEAQVPLPNPTHDQPQVDAGPSVDAGAVETGGALTLPTIELPPRPVPVSSAAQLLTSGSELKPPYPQSKLLNEEEAALRLRLTIDDRGRVVAVDPIGRADPVFLDAARRHLLAHWRYKPAIQDGRAVATSIVITLRFQLDG
jgi:protein TonB